MSAIHPSAVISENTKIGENVEIGPFCLIGPDVEIGDNTVLHSHVRIVGNTKIGASNQIFSFTSIGDLPQDLTYKGEPTTVEIGDHNIIREYVSIHRGTMKDRQKTTIGHHNLLMAYVHLGHDVDFGSHCVIANTTNFAGHVKVGDRVIIGGGTNISQFVTLGRGAYIGGGSGIDRDIPLFCTAYGNRVKLKGINIIGLRRQGYERQIISEVVDFYRLMEASALSPRSFVSNKDMISEFSHNEIIQLMIKSISESDIGIAPFV